MQRTGERGANALRRELVVRVEATLGASADQVYAVLADLSTHTVGGGAAGHEDAPVDDRRARGAGDRRDGVLQHGLRPDGLVADRSVVTEAQPGGHSSSSRRPVLNEEGNDERLDERGALPARTPRQRLPYRVHRSRH